jgi:hypothetical protein
LKGRGFSHAERKSFFINPNDYETHIELLILYTELGRKDQAVGWRLSVTLCVFEASQPSPLTISSSQYERDHTDFRSSVSPVVPRTILHNTITLLKVYLLAIVEF